MNAVCSTTKKPFVIRIDFAADQKWVITYANRTDQSFGGASVDGDERQVDFTNFRFGPQYKCPYCAAKGVVHCSCGILGCIDEKSDRFECGSCGKTGKISGSVKTLEGRRGKAQ